MDSHLRQGSPGLIPREALRLAPARTPGPTSAEEVLAGGSDKSPQSDAILEPREAEEARGCGSERNDVLREAEILHKARFSYILPILGICNEPEFLGIVTEYMPNGSLNELLHRKIEYPDVPWPLRFRILHEIALGVNYLHNMNPPLLHHDLKTQNILLDNEFHVKIADFGLSKWRMMSLSQSRSSKSAPEGGTIVYMPPENYEPGQKARASVKHDIYSYAIIIWEVLSRKQPFEDVTNPLQIMYSVSQGHRPDTNEESLPFDIPHRALMISLIESGWAQNPDERPSFLKCLIELEPVLRTFEEITFLEAVIQLKKTKLQNASRTVHLSDKKKRELSSNIPVNSGPQELQNKHCGHHATQRLGLVSLKLSARDLLSEMHSVTRERRRRMPDTEDNLHGLRQQSLLKIQKKGLYFSKLQQTHFQGKNNNNTTHSADE
ncbi:hypothetical protein E5288_WYG014969 [Bos mutus]|uniref:non-specific serine/threonine protein kinase n=1 Tax=Bos mutus TaxID=72004 RepID=A0A6B0RWD2_9CETA|nr:hypothetical protein [Bos mutus]